MTHYFQGHVPGYRGWRWVVTLSRAPDGDHVTVDETALLPDGDALLAPSWVPWKQQNRIRRSGPRRRAGHRGRRPQAVPGHGRRRRRRRDDRQRPAQWELGLGRIRVLSPEGRREAAQRWYHDMGPRAAVARATKLECSTCGFLLMIGGPMGQAFGVCANEYSPVDGRIVALSFGCGAHSETREKPSVGLRRQLSTRSRSTTSRRSRMRRTPARNRPSRHRLSQHRPAARPSHTDRRRRGSPGRADSHRAGRHRRRRGSQTDPGSDGASAAVDAGDDQESVPLSVPDAPDTEAGGSDTEVGDTASKHETMPEPGPKEDA